jgi:hypothetical protein
LTNGQAKLLEIKMIDLKDRGLPQEEPIDFIASLGVFFLLVALCFSPFARVIWHSFRSLF